MTRRIKRHKDFEITLEIKNDAFIQTPRPAQRNWVLNRCIKEFSEDLIALDQQAKHFIRGADPTESFVDRRHASLSPQEIMEDWQKPVMQAMAKAVTEHHGDILEIGFGRGVASEYLQACGVRSHTIIECNPEVIQDCETWTKDYPDQSIHIIPGMWQDVTEQLEMYDGIFFHTYPLNEQEYIEQVMQSVTFAEHFFEVASKHLKPGGHFSYLSNEADSLSRSHQRLLLSHFSTFRISQVHDLAIPEDSHDVQWNKKMVIIQATR